MAATFQQRYIVKRFFQVTGAKGLTQDFTIIKGHVHL
jgi:hypothetical protein